MTGLSRAAGLIASFEPGFVALAAPFLLFPGVRPTWTAAALVVVLGAWLARWIDGGRPSARSPLDSALLLLAITLPVAVWASTLPELTLPKLTGLILGLAAFRAVLNAVRTRHDLGWAVTAFLLLGLLVGGAGLAGGRWSDKVPALEPFLARIPRLLAGLTGAEQGIHPNELGGALILFLPVSLVACLGWDAGAWWKDSAARLLALLLSLFLLAMLLLSQSRSAWIGFVVGLVVMAWMRWRWARWPLLAALMAMVIVALLLGTQMAALLDEGATVNTQDWEGRPALWSRALLTIQDFPLSGTGLGSFRRVVHTLYPFQSSSPNADIAHAHNVFLQVALDLGLPGLVAYLALVGTALWACWRVAQEGDGPYRWLATGIAGSLVAFHVYGLTDTIALGAKPGVAFWLLLALAMALCRVGDEGEESAVVDGDRLEPALPETTQNAAGLERRPQNGTQAAVGDRLPASLRLRRVLAAWPPPRKRSSGTGLTYSAGKPPLLEGAPREQQDR